MGCVALLESTTPARHQPPQFLEPVLDDHDDDRRTAESIRISAPLELNV